VGFLCWVRVENPTALYYVHIPNRTTSAIARSASSHPNAGPARSGLVFMHSSLLSCSLLSLTHVVTNPTHHLSITFLHLAAAHFPGLFTDIGRRLHVNV
jgi:hypothetical protein